MDEQFCDVGRGITLCYETFGDPSDPTLLLVMGLGVQMVGWNEDLCKQLASRGYHVVRFDNRDAGRSTQTPAPPPSVGELLLRGRRTPARYKLNDMADDTSRLLDSLKRPPAHVIGASMGGMIAQTLAVRYPQHVRSLTSIMSTTGSRRVGQPRLRTYSVFLRRAPREREAFIEHGVRLFTAIGSRGLPRDVEDLRRLAALSYDRNRDPRGTGHQLAAIVASGDRTAQLARIHAPTLVIHGTVDPLIAPSGGRATARAIPGAQLLMIDGMGHDLPRAAWPQLIDAITTHAAHADRDRAARDADRADAAPSADRAGAAPSTDRALSLGET